MSKPLYVQALDSLRRREWLLRILIFTLVTVVFWIGFSIYLSQSESKVPIDIRKHTDPLNPNINRESLDELVQRQRYTEEDLLDFPLYEIVSDEDGNTFIQAVGSAPIPVTIIEDAETPLGSGAATPAPIVTLTPQATQSAAAATATPVPTATVQPAP